MKILQINTVCGKSGSVGRITADLYQFMKKNDIESYVAYSRGEAFGIDEKNGVRIGSLFDNYLDGAITRVFDNAGFNSKSATKKFLERVDEIAPDIIHLHNLHGYYIHVGLLFEYIKEKGIKVVWTLHDCWSFTGHCCYFDFLNCDKWQTGCNNCLETKIYPKAFLDSSKKNYTRKRNVFTSLDKDKVILVTPSKWLERIVKKSYLKDYETRTIVNGINISDFSVTDNDIRKRYALGNSRIVLGVANKWDRRKGLDDFISLSQMLGEGYAFIAIGVDDAQMAKLPPEVIGVKGTNSVKELAKFYSAADVYVNPTYEDNYPTTNMEAQACGCPVITYKTGGSCENIIDGYGFSVEKGNLGSLCKAVKHIFEVYIDKNQLAEKSKIFDKENTLKNYISLYNEFYGR